ncbi:expansin-like B1 [Silene latifolia]|uniref:expansin-like B1 n=1 Tax=Silene latifolia TaxID=37657 RepID=UPI003D76CDAE
MEFTVKSNCLMFMLVVLGCLVLSHSQDFICSKATYFGSPDCKGNPSGACGYGEYGRDGNDGYVAAVHSPYRNGTGCGGCYQVRCKVGGCTDEGVIVVATDSGGGDGTDFIFPAQVYSEMAQPGLEGELLSYGVVDIEYRRVPCDFGGSNLVIKVHEATKYPYYLAIIIVYPPGVYDVVGVQIWQEDSKTWRDMRKPYGAVWDIENPPKSETLTFSFLLSATGSVDDGEWVDSPTYVSTSLEAGATFDTGIHQL